MLNLYLPVGWQGIDGGLFTTRCSKLFDIISIGVANTGHSCLETLEQNKVMIMKIFVCFGWLIWGLTSHQQRKSYIWRWDLSL